MAPTFWKALKDQRRSGSEPVCDASCRLDAHATVARSEAAILTTRVR